MVEFYINYDGAEFYDEGDAFYSPVDEFYAPAGVEQIPQYGYEPNALTRELRAVRGGFININKTQATYTPGATDEIALGIIAWNASIEVYGYTRSGLPNTVRLFRDIHWTSTADANGHTSSIQPIQRWPVTMTIIVLYNEAPPIYQ